MPEPVNARVLFCWRAIKTPRNVNASKIVLLRKRLIYAVVRKRLYYGGGGAEYRTVFIL
jgi:hypothetical protein